MKEKANILIVDDNISLGKTMSFVLRRKGYSVITAEGGPEAIEKVKENTFDMVFMDIKMPLMDGVEVYRRMKKIRPGAVVVMMTAYAVENLIQQALAEGAYAVIQKPLDMGKVVTLIKSAYETKNGALILVVDDDPGTCITLKNILTKRGHKVSLAHSGEQAIDMVRQKAHDIIFIDMKLPTINGLETYLAIKENQPGAVAIMMTAYRQEMFHLMEEALSSNAYACLYKPFAPEELFKLIDEVQAGKQAARLLEEKGK